MSETITIANVFEGYGESLALQVVAGEKGMGNELASSDVHRPGLVLAGFVGLFTYEVKIYSKAIFFGRPH